MTPKVARNRWTCPADLKPACDVLVLELLVRIFRSIVRSLISYVFDIGQHLCLGGNITAQLVGDDGPWHVLQSLEQLPEESLGHLLVPARLNQDVEYSPVLINSAPQILQLAVDREVYFIEIPAVSRAG